MGAFFDRIDADLARMIPAMGQSFVLKGVTIPCGLTRPSVGNEPMEGGSWSDYSGVAFTRRMYFDNAKPTPIALPEEGDIITVDGVDRMVGKVKADAACPLVTIPFINPPAPR